MWTLRISVITSEMLFVVLSPRSHLAQVERFLLQIPRNIVHGPRRPLPCRTWCPDDCHSWRGEFIWEFSWHVWCSRTRISPILLVKILMLLGWWDGGIPDCWGNQRWPPDQTNCGLVHRDLCKNVHIRGAVILSSLIDHYSEFQEQERKADLSLFPFHNVIFRFSLAMLDPVHKVTQKLPMPKTLPWRRVAHTCHQPLMSWETSSSQIALLNMPVVITVKLSEVTERLIVTFDSLPLQRSVWQPGCKGRHNCKRRSCAPNRSHGLQLGSGETLYKQTKLSTKSRLAERLTGSQTWNCSFNSQTFWHRKLLENYLNFKSTSGARPYPQASILHDLNMWRERPGAALCWRPHHRCV